MQKLATDNELSGLLNLVIGSGMRLFTKWRFCKELPTSELRDLYERLADLVKTWIDKRCVLVPDAKGEKEMLHQDNIDFCYEKNYRRLSQNALGRALSHYGIHDSQAGSGKTLKHVWAGIRLANENLRDKEGEKTRASCLFGVIIRHGTHGLFCTS